MSIWGGVSIFVALRSSRIRSLKASFLGRVTENLQILPFPAKSCPPGPFSEVPVPPTPPTPVLAVRRYHTRVRGQSEWPSPRRTALAWVWRCCTAASSVSV